MLESIVAGLETRPVSFGAKIELNDDVSAESALFNERGARCVVTAAHRNVAALHSLAAQYGVAADAIGQVTGDGRLRIQYKERAILDSRVEKLREIWANSLEQTLLTK